MVPFFVDTLEMHVLLTKIKFLNNFLTFENYFLL